MKNRHTTQLSKARILHSYLSHHPPAMTATLPTVTIDGITYQIIKEKDFTITPAMVGWCQAPVTRQSLTLKRPRGKRFYHAVRYESGRYSSAA